MRTLIVVEDIFSAAAEPITCSECGTVLDTLKGHLEIAPDGTARVCKKGFCAEHGYQSLTQIIKAARVYGEDVEILPSIR